MCGWEGVVWRGGCDVWRGGCMVCAERGCDMFRGGCMMCAGGGSVCDVCWGGCASHITVEVVFHHHQALVQVCKQPQLGRWMSME